MSSIKSATKRVYDQIDTPFKELFGLNFCEAETKLTKLQLEAKKSTTDRKRSRREMTRANKQELQKIFVETEADAVLSVRQSLSQRGKKRKIQYFEDKEEAEVRAKKRKEMEHEGLLKKKRHSPETRKVDFDRDGLLQEVLDMADGEEVC